MLGCVRNRKAGPLGQNFNVALALRDDPELAGMIPQIAIMGGSLSGGNITPAAEFNLYVDPEAARIVFDARIPLTMVGLDATRKCVLSEAQIHQLEAAKNPVSQAAGKIMRATWERMKRGGEVTVIALHDALTVASLIEPDVITLKDYYVEVETTGEWTAGQTLGYDGHAPVRKSPPMDTSMPGPAAPEPLVDLNALTIRTFRTSQVGGSFYRAAILAVPFLLPLMFEDDFGWSAVVREEHAHVLFQFPERVI